MNDVGGEIDAVLHQRIDRVGRQRSIGERVDDRQLGDAAGAHRHRQRGRRRRRACKSIDNGAGAEYRLGEIAQRDHAVPIRIQNVGIERDVSRVDQDSVHEIPLCLTVAPAQLVILVQPMTATGSTSATAA